AMVRSSWRWRRLAFYVNALAPVVSLHGTIDGKAGLFYSGDGAQIVMELPIEGLQLCRFVACHLRIDMQDVAVCGNEAEVLMLHIIQTASQQSRRAQQRER